MMSMLTAPFLFFLSYSLCASFVSPTLASTNIYHLESDSWVLPWSEAGVREFPFSSNSVRNINAQYKADMPRPQVAILGISSSLSNSISEAKWFLFWFEN